MSKIKIWLGKKYGERKIIILKFLLHCLDDCKSPAMQNGEWVKLLLGFWQKEME